MVILLYTVFCMKKILIFIYDLYREVTLYFYNHYVYFVKGLDFYTEKQMEFTAEVGLWHEPTRKKLFCKVMKALNMDDLKQKSFFDIGCGKGNVLLEAHKYFFEKVGGVELSAKMYEICLENLKVHGLSNDNVFHKNASALTTELDDYDVFYLYNPFQEGVVASVVVNLLNSWQRMPRKVVVVYHNPKHGDVLLAQGFSLTNKLNEHHIDATRKVYFYEIS